MSTEKVKNKVLEHKRKENKEERQESVMSKIFNTLL